MRFEKWDGDVAWALAGTCWAAKRLEEQSEAGHDEAEAHDRETGASPRQEGALGGEEDAGVGHRTAAAHARA